jgi:cytoskeletal protein RodZ
MSQDSEVDNYLQGKSDLSRLYADAPQIEPPDHLDAAILAEAHRAVNARPGAKPKRRWAMPLGLVASLFAFVMIGLQLPYLLREPALQQAPMEAKTAAPMDESAAAPALRTQSKRMKALATDSAKSEMTGNKPAPVEVERYTQPAAPMAAAPAPVAKRLEMRESAEIQSAGALSKEKESAAVGGSNLNDTPELRAPAAALMASPQPAQLERALKKDEADKANLLPQDWLTRIRKLQQEGKHEEAKKELAAFKKRYPDYPVPAALEAR